MTAFQLLDCLASPRWVVIRCSPTERDERNRNEFLMTPNRRSPTSALLFGFELGLLLLAGTGLCLGQSLPPVRGVYTPGFNAINSGVMPEPGLTYANFFMDYSFDQFRSASGAIVAQNNAAVFIDINAFEW